MKKNCTRNPGATVCNWQDAWRWIIPTLIAVIVLWTILSVVWQSLPPEGLLAGIALILGVAYFLQQQHIEQARFFQELFTEFNRRYDILNNRLFGHLAQDAKTLFNAEQKQDFVDYFNLCAEEHLFHEAGYIYDDVWKAWRNGMRQFRRDSRVLDLWKKEYETGSYYGFDLLEGDED
jgi:hypothetical protein